MSKENEEVSFVYAHLKIKNTQELVIEKVRQTNCRKIESGVKRKEKPSHKISFCSI